MQCQINVKFNRHYILLKNKCLIVCIRKINFPQEFNKNNRMNEAVGTTCFRETGKVSFPQNSGLLTISLHIALQDRQTAAHATTCFRAGQELSLSSSLLITSKSSSAGRLAQRLFWITSDWSCKSFNEACDFPLWCPLNLTLKLRLDKLPILSLTSRTMLRKDMLQAVDNCWYKSLFWILLIPKMKKTQFPPQVLSKDNQSRDR